MISVCFVAAGETPQNSAGVAGDSIRLACHMPTQEIVWSFVPVNQTSAVALAVGCKLAPNVEQRYRVESEGGACHLLIDSLSAAHAGTYTCQDFVTGLKPASSELIVLGDFLATLLLRANLHVAEVQVLKRKC